MDHVVVILEPVFLRNPEGGQVAARFPRIGLTAYGATHDEALSALKRLFGVMVRARRRQSTLEDFLTRTKVEWYPEAQFPSGRGRIEYVDRPAHRSAVRHGPEAPDTAPPVWVRAHAMAA